MQQSRRRQRQLRQGGETETANLLHSQRKGGGISRSRNKHQQSFYGFETISDDDDEEEEDEEFGFGE